LFSGSGSFGKAKNEFGYDVVSLDLKGALINTDILDWNYKDYPVGYFDFIHASPPCVEYSIAKTIGVRKIIEANRIVKKTLEIIDYFKPKYWTIENPQTGLLKKQEFMEGLPYFDIDYCKYGFNYRKRRSELEFGVI
jgi:site-specific DNA-cytosine methylase